MKKKSLLRPPHPSLWLSWNKYKKSWTKLTKGLPDWLRTKWRNKKVIRSIKEESGSKSPNKPMKKNSSFSTNPTTNQKKTHKNHQKIKIKTPPLHQSHHRVKQQQYNTSHSTKSKAGSQCVKTNTSKSTNSNSDFLLCCLCVINVKIWSCGELNPRPLECKSSALPTELQPQLY